MRTLITNGTIVTADGSFAAGLDAWQAKAEGNAVADYGFHLIMSDVNDATLAEIVSTAPAKLFGMYPRKGAIAVGSDADIVVYDPTWRHTISAATHHMDVDYSCYEGREVVGGSDAVLSRGSVVVRNGEFTGRKGHGQFIRRARADHVRLS